MGICKGEINMGLKVTGKCRIFKNEYGGNVYYTTSIANKKTDGTYENMSVAAQFKKGMETEGNIEITDGFLSFYKTQQGLHKVKVVVMEYNKAQADYTMTEADMSELPF